MTGKKILPNEANERVRIGATLRQLREMRGFKADEFASEVNISRPYLANIEAGRKPLTEVLLAKMSTVLNVAQVVIIREGYFEENAA